MDLSLYLLTAFAFIAAARQSKIKVMKKSYDIVKGIVSIVVVIFSISGCIGKDTIHLSAHEMTVNADSQTVTVTNEGDRWWYDAVYYSTDDGGEEVVSEVLGKLEI